MGLFHFAHYTQCTPRILTRKNVSKGVYAMRAVSIKGQKWIKKFFRWFNVFDCFNGSQLSACTTIKTVHKLGCDTQSLLRSAGEPSKVLQPLLGSSSKLGARWEKSILGPAGSNST